MIEIRKLLLIAAFGLGLVNVPIGTAGTPPVMANGEVPTLAPMLERVLPGVVSIAVRGHVAVEQNPLFQDPFFRRFFGVPEQAQPRQREFQAAGSGVIVNPAEGYVITNNHVVEHAEEITVILSDGRRLKATKVGTDPATDVAVVRIPAEGLTGLPLGDSNAMHVGDYVVAVGNPFGLEQTVTSGIVSALGRTGLGIEGYESFIQTDASINPGNSGGALVNLRGELIGINSAIIGPSGGNVGIGFAIPINMARKVMEQLIAHGKVSRGQLGVQIQDLTPDLAKALDIDAHEGVVVASVVAKSPAEKAGLKAGDVIAAVDGERVRNSADLRNKIALLPVGSKVELAVIRDGAPKSVAVKLAEATPGTAEVQADEGKLAGVTLGPIEPGSKLYGHVRGVLVLEVEQGSAAAGAGLRAGDAIVAVDREPVTSPGEVIAKAQKTSGTLLLQVVRDGNMFFIAIG